MSAVLSEPEVETKVAELIKESEEMAGNFHIKKITSPEEYESAANYRKQILDKLSFLENLRLSITRPLDKAKSNIIDLFRRPINTLESIESKLKEKIISYKEEQEAIQKEAQRKSDEEARKKEEAERKRLEAQAKKADAKGDTDKAEELRERKEEVFVPAIVIPTAVPKVAGLRIMKIWRYKIIDVKKIPAEYMIPDEVKIGKVVKATSGTINIPGIEVYQEKV